MSAINGCQAQANQAGHTVTCLVPVIDWNPKTWQDCWNVRGSDPPKPLNGCCTIPERRAHGRSTHHEPQGRKR